MEEAKKGGRNIIKLSIPKKPEYVSVARLTASAVASKIGFNVEEIDDIKVALAEACINVIQSQTQNQTENIDIDFELYDDEISIVVKDTCKKTCDEDEEERDLLLVKDENLGMFIIKSLMDNVECINRDNKTQLRMIKRIGEKG